MTTRSFPKHIVSTTQPPSAQLGDEWFEPTSNKLYKAVAISGINVSWYEVLSTATSNTANLFTVGNLRVTSTGVFPGSVTAPALVPTNIFETVSVRASNASATVTFNVTSQSIMYFTGNTNANVIVDLRASDSNTLNSIMTVGQSVTAVLMLPQSSTAYYVTGVRVDGNTVVPKYQGGTAWSSGSTNSTDSYSFTVIKTADSSFAVFVSQTKFA